MASAAGTSASVWQRLSELNLKAISPCKLLQRPKRQTRRLRRKRSKAKYYAYLKERRFHLKTKTISLIDAVGMEGSCTCGGRQLSNNLADVAEWHQVEQVAYWKSRAISLQLENDMLYEHIKNVYGKQISDYEQSVKPSNILSNARESNSQSNENDTMDEDVAEKLPPKQSASEQKQNEMKKLYGDMAPKITGMETAVQLNYNRQVSRDKPHYWPNIPLKL